jgi:uncharacterized protein
MRVVLDANVFISALLSPAGTPAQILSCWEAQRFELIISTVILDELDRVLHYPKLQASYHLPEDGIQLFLRLLRAQATLISPVGMLSVIEQDPTDNRYLECAIDGDAQIIVSGDRHLLQLKEYQGIQILAPAGFIALLKLEE